MERHGLCTRLLGRLSPTFASFVAGIFLSTATNLYTNYVFDASCHCFRRIFLSATLLLAGACLLSMVSWVLQEIFETAVKNAPATISAHQRQRDKEALIEARGWRFLLSSILALACIVAGLAALQWKTLDPPTPAPTAAVPAPAQPAPAQPPSPAPK
jgi:hypothetical protein